MKLIENDFELTVQLLSQIWLKKPVIILVNPQSRVIPLFEELISLIPEYRQLIVCGSAPRGIIRNNHQSKFIEYENVETISETIFSLVGEEKAGKYIPLQILYFNVNENIFNQILLKIDHGWIAITALLPEKLKSYEAFKNYEVFTSVDFSTRFFLETTANSELEHKLLSRAANRSDAAAVYLIQKKFSEIRYAGEALFREIEAGNTLYQAELQELLEMDNLHLRKTLSVLHAENSLDLSRYIHLIPTVLEEALQKILRLEGILWVLTLSNRHVLGLAKSNNTENLPLNNLHRFETIIDRMANLYPFGKVDFFKIALVDGYQLVFLNFPSSNKDGNYIFAMLIDTGKYAVILINQIKKILNETLSIR